MSAAIDIGDDYATRCATDAASLACALFTRHRQHIYRECVFSLRSPHDAEDAVQQTYLNALRALQRGVRPRVEGAWLHEIARNVCRERKRNAARRGRLETTASPESLNDLAVSPAIPTEQQASQLRVALGRLEPRQREALLLREWRGLSYREIGGMLQLSQSAVEGLLFRARRSLARALEDGQRLRTTLNLVNLLAAFRTLRSGGAAKTAAIAACCAATVVAAPTLEKAVEHHQRPSQASRGGQRSPQPSRINASRSIRDRTAPATDIGADHDLAQAVLPASGRAGIGTHAGVGGTAAGTSRGEPSGSTNPATWKVAPAATSGTALSVELPVVEAQVNLDVTTDSVEAKASIGLHAGRSFDTTANVSADTSGSEAGASASLAAPEGTSAGVSINGPSTGNRASADVDAPGAAATGVSVQLPGPPGPASVK